MAPPSAALSCETIDAIPPDASVSTLSRFVPHLASREQIYLYPTVAGADYILFDTALDADFFPLISRDPRGEAIERLRAGSMCHDRIARRDQRSETGDRIVAHGEQIQVGFRPRFVDGKGRGAQRKGQLTRACGVAPRKSDQVRS